MVACRNRATGGPECQVVLLVGKAAISPKWRDATMSYAWNTRFQMEGLSPVSHVSIFNYPDLYNKFFK